MFEDELKQLYVNWFVHIDLERPNNIGCLAFDNILLTEQGLRLINVGISVLESQVGNYIFRKYIKLELEEIKVFREYFLNRQS